MVCSLIFEKVYHSATSTKDLVLIHDAYLDNIAIYLLNARHEFFLI